MLLWVLGSCQSETPLSATTVVIRLVQDTCLHALASLCLIYMQLSQVIDASRAMSVGPQAVKEVQADLHQALRHKIQDPRALGVNEARCMVSVQHNMGCSFADAY